MQWNTVRQIKVTEPALHRSTWTRLINTSFGEIKFFKREEDSIFFQLDEQKLWSLTIQNAGKDVEK